MVVGKYPFEYTTIYTLFENVAKGDYSVPEWVEPNLSDLIQSLMEVNPNKRLDIQQIKSHP